MATTDVDVPRETDVPELIPARMLNEFCYCPRLAYLEWVQGEFADNLETLEGRFGHRRVDRPSRQEVPEANEAGADTKSSDGDGGVPADVEKLHSRSVMLSAPGEGLIARIDVLDLESTVAVPVDYKRGKVPDVPGGAWEPEQVQLCAQGLILRENGYHCEAGILYFIESRRRVSVPLEVAAEAEPLAVLLGQIIGTTPWLTGVIGAVQPPATGARLPARTLGKILIDREKKQPEAGIPRQILVHHGVLRGRGKPYGVHPSETSIQ